MKTPLMGDVLLMPSSEAPIFNIVVGTAGHIDHGKSALVRRLTGINPDRLPEEKQRGMTIDLGFAPWQLSSGQRVGLIDVPGHEKFIKNMVAGAAGVDLVLLVVAADDGVMPQTREHLAIMELLGVRRGLVAVTKLDLVEPEYVELVHDDVKELVQGTFLEEAPILDVSSQTGEGLEQFREALERLVLETPARGTAGVFRMPIQRVFSARGFGTVVTGIPLSGELEPGAVVEILPLKRKGRIRGLQAYGRDVPRVRAGHSSALNLADIPHQEVTRGDVAVTPGYFPPTRHVAARLQYLKDAPGPLKHLAPIRFHCGTKEALGRVAVLDRRKVEPGERVLVELRLEEPMVVWPGDRFVLRRQSPMLTVGGGEVLEIANRRRRRLRERVLGDLKQAEESLKETQSFLSDRLRRLGTRASTVRDLAQAGGVPEAEARSRLQALIENGTAVPLGEVRAGQAPPVIHREALDALAEKLLARLEQFHEANPTRAGLRLEEMRRFRLAPPELLAAALAQLQRQKKLVKERDLYRHSARKALLTAAQQETAMKLEGVLLDAGLQTPRQDELAGHVAAPEPQVREVLNFLCEAGTVLRLKDGVLLHVQVMEEARAKLTEALRSSGPMPAGALRDVLGTSRKYLIPLLEYFDSVGVTVREGNNRRLA